MNFEPQKFFIGLVDFFSILLPGVMLTYLGKDWAARQLGYCYGFPLEGNEASLVFLFASYLLGHFLFLLGSLLDGLVWNPIRDWTEWGQFKQLSQGKPLSFKWLRKFAVSGLLFGKKPDSAVMQVQKIKARALHGLDADDAVNAYQWSKARLAKDFTEGLLAVQRFEANSKFFRSFVVLLGILVLFYGSRGQCHAAAVCMVAILLALWRYINQRFKGTHQAYWYIITMEAMNTKGSAGITRKDGLTHAGAIVYRNKGKAREFLLVEASGDRTQWVLPKGHIEAGENPRITAVREVQEETGCWAGVRHWLEDSHLGHGPGVPMVRWFLLELAEEVKDESPEKKWPEESRKHDWFPLSEAVEKATFPETKALLEKAEQCLKKSQPEKG